MMFVDFGTPGDRPRRDNSQGLSSDAALLVWSMRRLVVAWPRCHAVTVALQQRFEAEATGIEHLLRCWLAGLAMHAARPIQFAHPGASAIIADEGAILFVLRNAGDEEAAGSTLAALCDADAARTLLPLALALSRLTRLY